MAVLPIPTTLGGGAEGGAVGGVDCFITSFILILLFLLLLVLLFVLLLLLLLLFPSLPCYGLREGRCIRELVNFSLCLCLAAS